MTTTSASDREDVFARMLTTPFSKVALTFFVKFSLPSIKNVGFVGRYHQGNINVAVNS
jgi:hypothetical protein